MRNNLSRGFSSPLIIGVIALALVFGLVTLSSGSSSGGTASVWSSISSWFGGSSTDTTTSDTVTTSSSETTGNGAPSGPHYGLNIIGVPKAKTADMTGDSGHRIFVSLGSKNNPVETKIMLSQSTTDGVFRVLDANGTDGTASFELPAPGSYSIWARPLGKIGGTATMTTCATDITTGQEVCSTSNEVFLREGGKSSFRNVTTQLTSITLDPSLTDLIDACGSDTVSLFDSCLEDYFWSYDNSGLKLLQLRFYPN
jgi:hypothetical protein